MQALAAKLRSSPLIAILCAPILSEHMFREAADCCYVAVARCARAVIVPARTPGKNSPLRYSYLILYPLLIIAKYTSTALRWTMPGCTVLRDSSNSKVQVYRNSASAYLTFDIGSYQRAAQACVRVYFDNLIAYALAPAIAKSRRTLQAVKRGIRRRVAS